MWYVAHSAAPLVMPAPRDLYKGGALMATLSMFFGIVVKMYKERGGQQRIIS